MKNLSAKQLRAIPLLSQGIKSKDVAAEIGVAAQTLSEWHRSPQFLAELNNFRMEVLEEARNNLQYASGIAVATLVELAEGAQSLETRRKAALDILRMSGFEPESRSAFGWGIGQRTSEGVKHELEGTLGIYLKAKSLLS